MSLTETLLQANKVSREQIPNDMLAEMDAATEALIAGNFSSNSIALGSKFPETTLPNAKGDKVSVQDFIAKGPVVISFYRGGWCPYCNIELKALQKALPQFKEFGASLIAITPETPDNSLSTADKNNLSFEVLTDQDNLVAKDLGLVFQLEENIRTIYGNFGIDLAASNGNDAYELPMPATFVVSQEGEVIYKFVNEDYTKRADITEILSALKKVEA